MIFSFLMLSCDRNPGGTQMVMEPEMIMMWWNLNFLCP